MSHSAHFVIVGLGKTGLSVAQFLHSKKIAFTLMDSRIDPPYKKIFEESFKNTPAYFGSFNIDLITHAEKIILSPGIDPKFFFESIPREHHPKIISDIELFGQYANAPIIGITGTNAKGTVTTLIGEMIQKSGYSVLVGGNIGTPALDLLSLPNPDFYVLELSSFQLEITHSLPLKAAAFLNLTPDHLDRHATMENYGRIKQRIFLNADCAIFNRDDALTYPIYPVRQKYSFGSSLSKNLHELGIDTQSHQSIFLTHDTQHLMDTQSLQIKGKHNHLNAQAALALGLALDLPVDSMLETLKNFPGLAHRCEWVGSKNQVDWYNDSKGTNIGATLASLEGLGSAQKPSVVLILGGLGKNQDFSVLKDAVNRYAHTVILMGKDAKLIHQALNPENAKLPMATHFYFAATLSEVVQIAYEKAQPKDSVLFSPACASFDMFKDFEDRGDQFKLMALALMKETV